jgi:integrase
MPDPLVWRDYIDTGGPFARGCGGVRLGGAGRWDQVDFNGAVLHFRRVKNGTPSTHPIQGDELRALRRLQRESPSSPFVFVSERGSPFTTAGFARMI